MEQAALNRAKRPRRRPSTAPVDAAPETLDGGAAALDGAELALTDC